VIEVGQSYPATLTVTGEDGQPANPVTAACTLTLPDGTTQNLPVPLPPDVTGLLTVGYRTVMAGLHKLSWLTTAPDAAGTDYFNVREYASIMSVAEVRAHLNMTRPTGDGDAELRRFMQAATELVESKVGYCVRRDFTDRVSEGHWQIVLPRRPVLAVASVTSVWPGGPSWPAASLTPDLEAGIVMPSITAYPFWWPPWDVAYTAGRREIPERFIHAAKEQLRHLWDTQRGSQPPQILAGEEIFTATSGWSFSVPRRVLELLEQDMVPSS
jgi:hypothetical protein